MESHKYQVLFYEQTHLNFITFQDLYIYMKLELARIIEIVASEEYNRRHTLNELVSKRGQAI